MKNINKKVLALAVAVLLAFTGALNAQTAAKSKNPNSAPKPSSADVIPLDPAVRTGKLPNGFTYYITPIK